MKQKNKTEKLVNVYDCEQKGLPKSIIFADVNYTKPPFWSTLAAITKALSTVVRQPNLNITYIEHSEHLYETIYINKNK